MEEKSAGKNRTSREQVEAWGSLSNRERALRWKDFVFATSSTRFTGNRNSLVDVFRPPTSVLRFSRLLFYFAAPLRVLRQSRYPSSTAVSALFLRDGNGAFVVLAFVARAPFTMHRCGIRGRLHATLVSASLDSRGRANELTQSLCGNRETGHCFLRPRLCPVSTNLAAPHPWHGRLFHSLSLPHSPSLFAGIFSRNEIVARHRSISTLSCASDFVNYPLLWSMFARSLVVKNRFANSIAIPSTKRDGTRVR